MTDALEPVPPPADELALGKARVVLDALRAAALDPPFAFDQEVAEPLWAAAVGEYPVAVLTKAVGSWSLGHSKFPSVAEFLTITRFVAAEARRVDSSRHAQDARLCPECNDGHSDVHWVIVGREDPAARHARPCSLCLPARYDLYMRGHFDPTHVERGGCPACWDYLPSLRHKVKSASS